ncbi:hypothetical protein DXG03_003180 [Asterophora parasitica]|uniref:EXS domain-containing protein n=1 Tax=Asterophora parasitica TaxID=117018 RepID=A0A9P7KGF0_9AGAR|nr:hypothetical protein DXG03_003180 [Asterophora parasitica]
MGAGMSSWILPTVMSLPYLIRLRQCVVEYNHQGNTHRRPLYNAIKYASAFPAIYLSAAQRLSSGDGNEGTKTWIGGQLLAAIVNSLYSFWWDVTNDWGMDLLRLRSDDEKRDERLLPKRLVLPRLHSGTPLVPGHSSVELQDSMEIAQSSLGHSNRQKHYHPAGLRHSLHFPVLLYPILIALNLGLRLTWSMKVFTVVNVSSHADMTNFCLKMAELFRRWLWVFIRVEWEMIKKGREGHARLHADADRLDYEMIPSTTHERT